MDTDACTVTAADVMQPRVFTLAPDRPLDAAVRALLDSGFSGAPVVDESDHLVGVLSERDCIQSLASSAFYGEPTGLVSGAMHRDAHAVSPDTDLLRLTELFQENPCRRLPVVDDHGVVLGLIARRDLLRALDRLSRARRPHAETTYEAIQRHRDHPAR